LGQCLHVALDLLPVLPFGFARLQPGLGVVGEGVAGVAERDLQLRVQRLGFGLQAGEAGPQLLAACAVVGQGLLLQRKLALCGLQQAAALLVRIPGLLHGLLAPFGGLHGVPQGVQLPGAGLGRRGQGFCLLPAVCGQLQGLCEVLPGAVPACDVLAQCIGLALACGLGGQGGGQRGAGCFALGLQGV
jgi:hypothetical protein